MEKLGRQAFAFVLAVQMALGPLGVQLAYAQTAREQARRDAERAALARQQAAALERIAAARRDEDSRDVNVHRRRELGHFVGVVAMVAERSVETLRAGVGDDHDDLRGIRPPDTLELADLLSDRSRAGTEMVQHGVERFVVGNAESRARNGRHSRDRIVESGAVESIFSTPQADYTRMLLAAAPRIEGERSRELPAPADGPPVLRVDDVGVAFPVKIERGLFGLLVFGGFVGGGVWVSEMIGGAGGESRTTPNSSGSSSAA